MAKSNSKERAKPANVREYLNSASKVAAQIVDVLSVKTARGELLDATELANYKMAVEAMKTCRELYLRQQALKKNNAAVQQMFVSGPSAVSDELRFLAASLVASQTQSTVARPKRGESDDE